MFILHVEGCERRSQAWLLRMMREGDMAMLEGGWSSGDDVIDDLLSMVLFLPQTRRCVSPI